MAPMARADQNILEQQLKDTIQSLHNVMVQVSAYDTATTPASTPNSISSPAGGAGSRGGTSKDVIAAELSMLSSNLQRVHKTAATPSPSESLPHIPPELIQYVDNGRNPDIYTREFVELVRRGNQLMRGKQAAFASFRDVLAGEIEKAMPELAEDASRTVAATGGPGRR
ncbi:mediator complex, subunit Med10 [Biscogniauxia marginata]|nr:mediator complex, subunit Med10 [Biscogniauxia marginata]